MRSMSGRRFLQASFTAVVVLASPMAFGLKSRGTYRLEVGSASRLTINDKRMPSCGAAAFGYFDQVSRFVVVYEKTITVNERPWNIKTGVSDYVIVTDPESPARSRIDIWFKRDDDKKDASGYVVYNGIGDDLTVKCADTRSLSGSYDR